MIAKVTEQGVLIPKELLKGIEEVEIRQQDGLIIVAPVAVDPIFQLAAHPIEDNVADASENHDAYIYGR